MWMGQVNNFSKTETIVLIVSFWSFKTVRTCDWSL